MSRLGLLSRLQCTIAGEFYLFSYYTDRVTIDFDTEHIEIYFEDQLEYKIMCCIPEFGYNVGYWQEHPISRSLTVKQNVGLWDIRAVVALVGAQIQDFKK